MIRVKDICETIEAFAPLTFQEPEDNVGLLVGNPETSLTGVLICLDVTEAVIDEALITGCNMIVSHHPLLYKGIKQVVGSGRVERCLIKAIKHDLSIYASHTNIDSVIEGVSGELANQLGMKNVSILSVAGTSETHGEYGLGVVGDLETPVDEASFLGTIKSLLNGQSIRHSVPTGKTVSRVAICGGSGSSYLAEARRAGATVLLTGEARFHEFFTEGLGIMLVDAGHFETEQHTKALFFNLISKKFPTFAVRISSAEANPVNYL
jgi:dinuclear metal center YbgI/SA1388 family protein